MLSFNISTEELKKILYSIQIICQKRTVSESTQNVCILIDGDDIFFRATDLEVFVEFQTRISSLKENFKQKRLNFSVNARRFYEIIKDVDDSQLKLMIKLDDEATQTEIKNDEPNSIFGIISSNFEIFLNIYNSDLFEINKAPIENLFSIKAIEFSNALSYCIPLTPTNIHQPGINSILFELLDESFNVTSTDGHCLAHIKIFSGIDKTDTEFTFSLTKKACSDLKKILEFSQNNNIFIGRSSTEIVLTGTNFCIYIKTVSEKFPEYKKIINPESSSSWQLSCEYSSFSKIIRRLSSLTAGKFIPATISISKEKSNLLYFNINNKEVGFAHENLEIQNEGEINDDLSISVYPPYLLQAASSVEMNNNLTLLMQGKKKPLIVKYKNDKQLMLYVVMPMLSV